jgi:hypothetical protein
MPLIAIREREPDGKPILGEDEVIQKYWSPSAVRLYVGEDAGTNGLGPGEGVGSLYITNKHVIWLSDEDIQKGISIDFPYITLHAVCRDTNLFPLPCIYCQLDSEELRELRFVPIDSSNLYEIYQAFCEGAALNPDLEQEGEGDFVFNPEEVAAGLEQAMETAAFDMGELHDSLDGDNQFADPEAEEEEEEAERQSAGGGVQGMSE